MPQRVALVGVFHETNTFSPVATDRADFARTYRGRELADAFAGTRTVVGGFIDGARARNLEVVPVFGAYATPAGRVTAAAFAEILGGIANGLRSLPPVDGVLLELHGAMVAEGVADAEREVVELVRRSLPGVPIAAVLDLHANVGVRRLDAVEVLIGYRTNPHVDTYARGRDAVRHLAAVLGGTLTPYRAHRGVPVIAAPVAQGTDAEPLAAVLRRARQLETGLVDITVHAGYAYADVPHLGMGVSVTADHSDREAAEAAAEELARLAWDLRGGFELRLPPAAEAFSRAASAAGCVAVADTGDNINGGSPGDGTWLLAEALRRPDVRTLASVYDPDAVDAAERAGVGAQAQLSVGGRAAPSSGSPARMDATVLRLGRGTFTNRGPMSTGAVVNMGAVAVLRAGRLDLVVQERPVQPNDPEMFRSLDLCPEQYQVVLLKGAAAIRAGWSSVVSDFVDAGTPGVSDSDLTRLTFQHAPQGLFPVSIRRDRRPTRPSQ